MKALDLFICMIQAGCLFVGALGIGVMFANIISGCPVYGWPMWIILSIGLMKLSTIQRKERG